MFLQVTITTLYTVCRQRSHGGDTTASTRPPSQQLEHLEEPTAPIQPPPDLLAAGVPGAAPPDLLAAGVPGAAPLCSPHSPEGGGKREEGERAARVGVGGGKG